MTTYQVVDLFIKCIIGIFIAIYLHKRSRKNNLKDSLVDLYCKLIEDYDNLCSYRHYHNLRKLVNLITEDVFLQSNLNELTPELSPIISQWYKETFENDMSKIDKYEDSYSEFLKKLRKMRLIIGLTKYDKDIRQFRYDLNLFYYLNSVIDYYDYFVKELSHRECSIKIVKLFAAYNKGALTQGELKSRIGDVLLPLASDYERKYYDELNRRFGTYLSDLIQIVDKY